MGRQAAKNYILLLLMTFAPSAILVGQDLPDIDPSRRYVGEFSFIVTTSLANIYQHFTSVSAIVSNTRVLQDGTAKTSFDPVILTRLYTGKDDLYAWRLEVESGVIVKRNITIDVINVVFEPIMTYTLTGAWPSKWSKGPMKAKSGTGPLEKITLTFDSIQVVDTSP